MTKDTMNKDNQ